MSDLRHEDALHPDTEVPVLETWVFRAYRWGFYLLVPGRLHVIAHPWYFHACRAGRMK